LLLTTGNVTSLRRLFVFSGVNGCNGQLSTKLAKAGRTKWKADWPTLDPDACYRVERTSPRTGLSPAERPAHFTAHFVANYGTVEALFAVAMRLVLLTVFPGIIDVDVILNCTLPVLREIDFQMRPIAPLITLKHSETNQIVGTFGVELGEVPAFRQWLYQKVAVLVSSRILEKRSATFPVLVGCEQ
jgi:hypothetical protein